MRVLISRVTYYACLDPSATGFYREFPEIGEPQLIRWGKGFRADFGDLLPVSVRGLLDHLESYAETFSMGGSDFETAADGRAIRRDADRIRKELESIPTANQSE